MYKTNSDFDTISQLKLRKKCVLKFKIIQIYKLLSRCLLLGVSCALIGGATFASPSTEGIQIYQKNLPLSPEHKQKLADDITRYRTADNIWDVLREEFSLPHYENNSEVQEKIEWFMNNQDSLLRAASRAAPYLYYILQQVKKRHLPAELVLLPIIESGYNPFSLSNVGAAGIWQLMPDTASSLGIKRNIRNGIDTDFWSLPVAQETKDYVPSLLALAIIISHPDQYPIYFPPVRNAPYLAQVDAGTQISLKYAAILAGISHKKMIQLNPGFGRSSPNKKGPSKFVLPIENIEQFTENLAQSPLNRPINWAHYKVKSGDTILSIAKKFDTTVSAIRKLNHLSKNNLRQGTNLLIPANAQSDLNPNKTMADSKTNSSVTTIANKILPKEIKNSSTPSQTSTQYFLQPGDTIYMVRSKDTLQSIANRFHIKSNDLQAVNHVTSKQINPGKQLIIPTHLSLANIKQSSSIAHALQPGDTLYMVRRDDTIEKIAKKFHTTPANIRLANLIDNHSLIEGEKIVVPTHIRG